MRKTILTMVVVMVVCLPLMFLTGCGDDNSQTITGSDWTYQESVDGDNTAGGCCDDETASTCYSLPSGSERPCEGCTIGVDCSLTPVETEEEEEE